MTTWHHCQTEFTPKRTWGRYCSTACRMADHRGMPAKSATAHRALAQECVTEGARATDAHPASKVGLVTHQTRIPRPLSAGIVPDHRWPGMYRFRLPGGGLSDMVNLTRARDGQG